MTAQLGELSDALCCCDGVLCATPLWGPQEPGWEPQDSIATPVLRRCCQVGRGIQTRTVQLARGGPCLSRGPTGPVSAQVPPESLAARPWVAAQLLKCEEERVILGSLPCPCLYPRVEQECGRQRGGRESTLRLRFSRSGGRAVLEEDRRRGRPPDVQRASPHPGPGLRSSCLLLAAWWLDAGLSTLCFPGLGVGGGVRGGLWLVGREGRLWAHPMSEHAGRGAGSRPHTAGSPCPARRAEMVQSERLE